MNKMIKSLLAGALACTSFVSATLDSGKTFIAHRDELANLGMQWASKETKMWHRSNCGSYTKETCIDKKCDTNATKQNAKKVAKKEAKRFGAKLTATGFYSESTNDTDLATLFGMGTTGAIKVTAGLPVSATGASTAHTALYSLDIEHSPNSDGVTATSTGNTDADNAGLEYGRIATSGTVNFAPKRQAYGAYLGWNQSLDALLDGLSFTVRAPIVQVRSSMNPKTVGEVKSNIPPVDGKSNVGLLDYFSGKLTNSIDATNLHVNQAALTKNKFGTTKNVVTGLADLELGVQYSWNCKAMKAVTWGLGALAQVPTGNKPDNANLFESIYGARGHVAAGANGFMHINAYKKNDVRVSFDMMANWKYFFKGTEKRTMGIYDLVNKVMLPASQYRLVMTHGITGVQPAANVLSLDHTVTPGHQVEGLAGVSATWKNFSFNLGYNVFWHQAEKVVQKAAWTNDKFALAHPHYSMSTTVRADDIVGGTSYLDGDVNINHNGLIGRDADTDGAGNYNDTSAPVTKHGYYIGANGDSGGTAYILPYALVAPGLEDDNKYPGAFTSFNGPIQKSGTTTSTLTKRGVADEDVGVDEAKAGTLTVNYNVSSLPAVTAAQITHSIVGGVNYRFKTGCCPVTIGIGGSAELQESSRNSALEGFKVWAKCGISF